MPAVLTFELPDTAATEALGIALARVVPGAAHGAVIYLRGELGAGKTTCARSLLHALGVRGPVRSPTYTLLEVYSLGAYVCVHVDLYRLHSRAQVEELGLRDLTGPGHLMLIEWPDNGAGVPPADLLVTLSYATHGRRAELAAGNGAAAEWRDKLALDKSLARYVSNKT